MPVQPGDVVRIVARMEKDGTEDNLNVYHTKHMGSTNITNSGFMTAVAARLDSAYTKLKSELTTDLEFIEVEFYNVTQDVWMGTEGWPTLVAGLNTAEELPSQVSALVTFRTATTQHPGKKFLGGYTEDVNAGDGVLSAGGLTQLGLYVVELLLTMVIESNAVFFGNYNYVLPRWAQWVAGAVDTIWSTQRRRKPGIGS